jgi:hypothetical protein
MEEIQWPEQWQEHGEQALQVGWGCPLEGPISGIRAAFGSELLGYVNYFIPIAEMAAILSVWVVAIAAYYVASVALRWAKAIS